MHSNIYLDTFSVNQLFVPNSKKSEYRGSVKENKNNIWSHFLDMNNRIFKKKGYVFGNIITTDGTAINLIFYKLDEEGKPCNKKKKLEELKPAYIEKVKLTEDLKDTKKTKYICADPNMGNII